MHVEYCRNLLKNYTNLNIEVDNLMKGSLYFLTKSKYYNTNAYIIGGDVITDISWDFIFKKHQTSKKVFTSVFSQTNISSNGLVFNNKSKIIQRGISNRGDFINLGIYIAEPQIINILNSSNIDLYSEDNVMTLLSDENNVLLYNGIGYNVNIPENYENALKELNAH